MLAHDRLYLQARCCALYSCHGGHFFRQLLDLLLSCQVLNAVLLSCARRRVVLLCTASLSGHLFRQQLLLLFGNPLSR
jgi:hypothetical protein